jgi:catechol 2,3-dioxygenase-like lactoylglutathione lyase family enzyme
MIGYVTLGTNDLPRAATYYDALLAEIGAKRTWEYERGIGWGQSASGTSLGIMKPFDGKPATVGNGVMVALQVDSKETVDRVCRKALALGSQDEGPAGPRSPTFYSAYFRDPDGNKLSVYFEG